MAYQDLMERKGLPWAVTPHSQIDQVLACLRELGHATYQDIADRMNCDGRTVSTALRRLDERGLIIWTGTKVKTRSGRFARVWEASAQTG